MSSGGALNWILVTRVTQAAQLVCYRSSVPWNFRKKSESSKRPGGSFRNHNVWLVLTWMGLILLMARAYS
jgi:hypothetical protein